MTIKREDLAAAAATGLLQYRQVEPLLVFLLQRDVLALRESMQQRQRPLQGSINRWLGRVVALLATVTAVLFAVLFVSRAMPSNDIAAVTFFAFVYGGAVLMLAAWFQRRGVGARVRILTAIAMASLPIAVLALQQVAN